MTKRFPQLLLITYSIFFIILSISPFDRAYWFACNLAPLIICFILIKLYPVFRFSNFAYLLASILPFLQTLGAHYFFHRIPFDVVTELFQFERHNFDRLVHITVGFNAFLIAEYLFVKKKLNSKWLLFLTSFSVIMCIAALYEIVEWIYVILVSPGSNADFIGAQGDIWDAQKDMACDGLGAIIALIIFDIKTYKKRDLAS